LRVKEDAESDPTKTAVLSVTTERWEPVREIGKEQGRQEATLESS